jgi:holin-like protein
MKKLLPIPSVPAAFQAAFLCLLFWLCGQCVQHFGLHVAVAPLGFVLVLLAMLSGILPLRVLEHGARWLLAESMLFFVPAIVSVARQRLVFEHNWLPMASVVVLGTLATLFATALTVDVTSRMMLRRQA